MYLQKIKYHYLNYKCINLGDVKLRKIAFNCYLMFWDGTTMYHY